MRGRAKFWMEPRSNPDITMGAPLYRGTPPDIVIKRDGSPLELRLDLANKSPTGFSWGYLGSGPAQLALAILADYADDETALRYYQRFKELVICALPQRGAWTLTAAHIETALRLLKERDNRDVSAITENVHGCEYRHGDSTP